MYATGQTWYVCRTTFAEERASMGYCSVADCNRLSFRNNLCGGHYKRHQRGRCIDGGLAEILTPEEHVIKVGSEWLDISAEVDDSVYRRKRAAFLRAAAAWLLTLGWQRPPSGTTNRARF